MVTDMTLAYSCSRCGARLDTTNASEIDAYTGCMPTALDILNCEKGELHAEIERLRAAVLKYGQHTSMCRWRGGFDCDCGWDDTKRTARGRNSDLDAGKP
jgi:hypothetical protein